VVSGSKGEEAALRRRAEAAVAEVADPELPFLTVADLGILRDISVRDGGAVEVTITPTYSGCPAMDLIRLEVETALARAGIEGARIRVALCPAWTTDWLSAAGRAKLAEAGIAPPPPGGGRRALFGADVLTCPHCASRHTELISEFGTTACKALHRCLDCTEPFEAFKCH
jgi:ring-1,2-phenylacetyl-CoA epoxidase subunit PaaD